VARNIAEHFTDYRIVINKSTVPVGTADLVNAEIDKVLDKRGVKVRRSEAGRGRREHLGPRAQARHRRVRVRDDGPIIAAIQRYMHDNPTQWFR